MHGGVELARNLAADLRLLPLLRRGRPGILRDRAGFDVVAFLELLLERGTSPLAPGWQVQQTLPTLTDNVVILAGPPHEPPEVILKVAGGVRGRIALEREIGVLTALHADARLPAFQGLLPVIHDEGVLAGRRYVVESVVPGVEADSVLRSGGATRRALPAAARAIAGLHGATQSDPIVLDRHLLEHWVDQPVAVLEQVLVYGARGSARSEALAQLADAAHRAFDGRAVVHSWVHGDYVPANIFLTPDGESVTGVVDWELASPDGLPHLDVVYLVLSTRVLVRRRELGQIVRELLIDPQLDDSEHAALESASRALPGDPLDLRSLVLLCWLQVASATLLKSERYPRSRLWVKLNVESVLRAYGAVAER
jgi:aminoglycoside phosphotransferase (APT) family kinase protein